jgi:thiamine biosynthesis protein ThiS
MQATVTVLINGESRSVPASASVNELLDYLQIKPDRVAIELNRRIVRRQDWERTPVQDSDKLEIVQFVGGG